MRSAISEVDYDDAINSFERALLINPSHMRARMWLIAAFAKTERADEVEWQIAELLLTHPGFSLANLEYAFPFRDRSVGQALLETLRRAGLPK